MSMNPPSAANLRGAVDLSSLVNRPPASEAGAGAAGASTQGATVAVPALVVDSGDAAFTGLVELSNTVPVVVEFHAGQPWAGIANAVRAQAGKIVLASVDATANPQLRQAFNVSAVPTIAAVIGGRPLPLFEGELPDAEIGQLFEQLLTLAAQNGVTGTAVVDDGGAEPEEPVEEPLPPHHQAAYDAIERGDYASAITAYETAIAQDPRDSLAVAGLAQVKLLHRLTGKTAADIRSAAGDRPSDLDAQLDVADLDVSGGHLDDAFARLLELFVGLDQAGKDTVRARMLEYFEVAGPEDPRVAVARRRLTALLY